MSRSPIRMIFTCTSIGSGLSAAVLKGKNRFHRLDFQFPVIEGALQRAPYACFGQRVERVHHQKSAVGAQQRAAAQVHEIGIPAAARVVAAMNRAEKVRVGGNRFENHRAGFLLAVRQNHVDAVHAEWIALAVRSARGPSPASAGSCSSSPSRSLNGSRLSRRGAGPPRDTRRSAC